MAGLNGVMMQYFHWYSPADGGLWNEVSANAKDLSDAGFSAVWLPPAYKGIGGDHDVGYGAYDLFDLGEFDQKGSVRTKYGNREEYLSSISSLQANGIQVYADAVLNHRIGGDQKETMKATAFPKNNRLESKGDLHEIESYTHFNFPGRQGNYSSFEWHWWHFDAVDYNARGGEDNTVYLLEGKQFDDYVALEKGNFAYLMGCDLDFQHEEVREEVTDWGKWYLDTTGVDGFRLDAIKHISSWFFPEWISALKAHAKKDLFFVGEYWYLDVDLLLWYVDAVQGEMSVLDVPLHYNFHFASISGGNYNMSQILDGTVMQTRPSNAVTFVDNHDSQPLQALQSDVAPWFKPLAYATILLRQEGYPCVFHADYYGANYSDIGYDIYMPSHRFLIDRFLDVRRNYAYGPQYDYIDHVDTIGWTRLGDKEHPKAMAVLMTDGPFGTKWMNVGKPNIELVDITEHITHSIYADEWGRANFLCHGASVSIWVEV